jgi:hypothetical protein
MGRLERLRTAKHTLLVTAATLVLLGLADAGIAEMYIYPSKGQSQEQQEKDQWECHQWAVQQTGVDPEQIANEATAPETYGREAVGGWAARGAARGAALGAVGGAIGGDAGKGAAMGAAMGGTMGILRARRRAELQYAYNQNLADTRRAQLRQYDRAYKTCLMGRGYTVS